MAQTAADRADPADKTEETDDVTWEDKDIDEFDVIMPASDGDNLQHEDDHPVEVKEKPKKRKRVKSLTQLVNDSTGMVYPVDLWYIISKYIQPENVGAFASICQDANRIIHTPSFWKILYLRFYSRRAPLPADLQKENIERLHGLRERVIRSMFYLHQPLMNRVQSSVPFEDDSHALEGRKCLLFWHKSIKSNIWNFCFKFASDLRYGNVITGKQELDLLNGHRDVFHNPEDKCCVLQVSCQNFQLVQNIMGQVLNKVYFNVSKDMRHHRLKLVFDQSMKFSVNYQSVPESTVVLDPVLHLRVFHWWDPNYPFFNHC